MTETPLSIDKAVEASPVIRDPERINVLRNLGLLDSPPESGFDRLTQLVGKIIDAPVTLVALIDADRSFFKSTFGLDTDMPRSVPLSHSICKHVVATGEPLVIADTRLDERVHDNAAVTEMGVVSYLGMPLFSASGLGLGSFCVMDVKPRAWSEREIEIVRELALSVMVEIELKTQLVARKAAEAKVQEANERLNLRNQQLRRVTEFCRSTIETMFDTTQRGTTKAETLEYLREAQKELNHQEIEIS
jgi:GAF domain-containing protein